MNGRCPLRALSLSPSALYEAMPIRVICTDTRVITSVDPRPRATLLAIQASAIKLTPPSGDLGVDPVCPPWVLNAVARDHLA